MIPLDFLSRAQKETIEPFIERVPDGAAGTNFVWKPRSEENALLLAVSFSFITNITAGNRYVGLTWVNDRNPSTDSTIVAMTHALGPQAASVIGFHSFVLANSAQTALINADVGHHILPPVLVMSNMSVTSNNDLGGATDTFTGIVIQGLRWKAYPTRYNVSARKQR